MAEKRRCYSKEFKDDAVQYLNKHPEKSITDAASSLEYKEIYSAEGEKYSQEHSFVDFNSAAGSNY